MAKKIERKLFKPAEAQLEVEKNTDKFESTQDLAHSRKPQEVSHGRISPQISCTILPEDKQLLNELTIYSINKAGKILNTSTIIRSLIRLGIKRKEELEF
jgi:hypothetical protein